jgi:hypothetical protein
MIISKYILYIAHYILIIYTLYLLSYYNTYIAILIYLSWIYNDNYCLLSQIEYKCYGETCMFTKIKRVSRGEKYLLLSSQIIKFFLLP